MSGNHDLAARSDTLALPEDSAIEDHDGFRVLCTATRPDFRWGNYLMLASEPELDRVELWFERCARELTDVAIDQLRIVWESGLGAEWRLTSDDLLYDRCVVLAARGSTDVRISVPGIEFRALRDDADWARALELTVANAGDEFGPGYPQFARWRMAEYRRTLALRGGDWWGAFDGEALVGGLGLVESPELLRFQSVDTRSSHRRLGIASALIGASLRAAFARHPCATAVIVATADSAAERLYRRLGFEPVALQHSLHRERRAADGGV